MENEEQKPIEEVIEEVKEELSQEPEAKKEDRPEINYKRELERRRATEDRLRAELEAERSKQVKRHDPNDITTWSDTELYALKNSMDPNHIQYKQQAEDVLFERKLEKAMERERTQTKRMNAEMQLRTQFPDAVNPSSDFAVKMEEVMYEFDLQKSPAGRLAAAKIVAAEFQKGSGKANAAGRKQEEARLKDVKQTLAEGDRPDPRANIPNPKAKEDLIKEMNNTKDINKASSAFGKVLGIDPDKFFRR